MSQTPDGDARGATGQRPILLLVCPADFEGVSVNLGAESKISALARVFLTLGFNVHYVDSSHWDARWSAPVLGRASRIKATPVTLWRPFKVPNRKLGKLLNVVAIDSFLVKLQALKPALVWVYNSYAFEGAVAQRFCRSGVPVVFEIEDMPLSRLRGWNPKPYWDQKHFDALITKANLVTFVNDGLLKRYCNQVKRSMLLPSVLSNGLATMPRQRRFSANRLRVGYFGGLSKNKGADILLEATAKLPQPWDMVVTGTGELGAMFEAAARDHPGRFVFHGTVSQSEMHALMAACDVIVNPHTSIAAMRDGVFPFKVCESIASGALLVSSALPPIDEPLEGAVSFFDGTAQGLIEALNGAREFDARNSAAINCLRERIAHEYSETEVARRLATVLGELLQTDTEFDFVQPVGTLTHQGVAR